MSKPKIDFRIVKARTALVTGHCFFGALALYLKVEEDEAIGTMATDGVKLVYAPSFLDKINQKELQGVIAHEVLHCAYQHMARRGERDPELWNKACDYAVNRDLLSSGFMLPKDRLYDPAFGQLGAEEIYKALQKQQKGAPKPLGGPPAGKQGQGQPDKAQGQGASGQGSGKPWGWVMDAASPGNQAQASKIAAEWDRRTKQALAISAANPGSIPGALKASIQAMLEPKVNWRDELRRFIDSKVRCDHDWTHPNKRYLSMGLTLPGIKQDGIAKLGIVIDTSGSIDDTLLSQFLAEIQAAIDEGAADQAIVVQCDAAVQATHSFDRGEEIKIQIVGRGGTAFSPAFNWLNQNEPDLSALIYFTDLECYDFGQEPSYPVLWAAYGSRARYGKVPFGEVIPVDN